MEEIDRVLERYIPTSTQVVDGRVQRRKVSGTNEIGADLQIRQTLPLIRSEIEKSGRYPNSFRVYGSVGQINFPLAKVPWVSALRRNITTSTERGTTSCFCFGRHGRMRTVAQSGIYPVPRFMWRRLAGRTQVKGGRYPCSKLP